MAPEEWARRAKPLLAELAKLRPRIHVSIIPRRFTDDQAKRLTRCVDKVLEAGEPGLRTIEDALNG